VLFVFAARLERWNKFMRTSALSPKNLWLVLLVSLSFLMGVQVVRVFVNTMVYAFGERFGQTLAAVPALLVFLSPFLVLLLAKALTPRRLLFIGVGGLAVVRLLMQISRDINLNMILSGLAVILALIGLVAALHWLSSTDAARRKAFAQGIVIGLIVEIGLHGAFLTWDYVWQSGIVPLLTALVVSGGALFALWQLRADLPDQPAQEPAFGALRPLIALGAFFMLELLFLQNMAFVTSSGLTSLEVGLVVVLIGNAIGLWMLDWFPAQSVIIRVLGVLLLTVAAALLPITSGGLVIVLVLVGQAVAIGLLPSMLGGLTPDAPRPGISRTTTAVGLASLLFALLAILYYISGLITLPFAYTMLPPVAGIALLLAAFAPAIPTSSAPNWRLIALPLALLLVPLALYVTRPALPTSTENADSFRMVDYNIHQGINYSGWVDLEAVAQVIEAENPALINLQEISRGWLIAGSVDNAEWLSRRLNMPFVYAPGHDYQFGNMILSRLPILDWSWERLPLKDVPLGRALIRATLDLGAGRTLNVINTHLSAYATTESRIPQVEAVLANWNGAPYTLISGDMNAHPEDGDTALFAQAGLTSAQDVAGDPAALTFSSADQYERIDYIYGTSELSFADFVITPTQASDHLPLAVTVSVR